VVQESYLRVWKRQSAKPIESVKSFLFTVAKHLALGTLRRERRSPIFDLMDLAATSIIDDGPGVAEMTCSREEIEILFAALSTLSTRTREVYLLRKFERLSQQEIALRLGISANTVEVHVGRANKHCAGFLRRRGVFRRLEP
jgi:RNA polymerase sigma factor (sigma-70 family)